MQHIAQARLDINYSTGEWTAHVLTTPDVNGLVAAYVIADGHPEHAMYESPVHAAFNAVNVLDACLFRGAKLTRREAMEVFGDSAQAYRR